MWLTPLNVHFILVLFFVVVLIGPVVVTLVVGGLVGGVVGGLVGGGVGGLVGGAGALVVFFVVKTVKGGVDVVCCGGFLFLFGDLNCGWLLLLFF